MNEHIAEKKRVGLALGSGSARGWAHIGIIRALLEERIEPQIVAGCSIGALVGAAYVSGNLDRLEKWVRALTFWDVVKLLDIKLRGGLIEGVALISSFAETVKKIQITDLEQPFGAVATDLISGSEVWLQQGFLPDVVRASIALPGLFTPVKHEGKWLVDGGLTNPVPVSLCRAMGADIIIAVNLNSDIVGKHFRPKEVRHVPDPGERDLFQQMLQKLKKELPGNIKIPDSIIPATSPSARTKSEPIIPGLFEVMASSINIMQDRITKNRIASDPPDILLTPRLAQIGLLEFDRAEESIAEGYETARRSMPEILHMCEINK